MEPSHQPRGTVFVNRLSVAGCLPLCVCSLQVCVCVCVCVCAPGLRLQAHADTEAYCLDSALENTGFESFEVKLMKQKATI